MVPKQKDGAEEVTGVSIRAYSHHVVEREADEFSASWEGGRRPADREV